MVQSALQLAEPVEVEAVCVTEAEAEVAELAADELEAEAVELVVVEQSAKGMDKSPDGQTKHSQRC